jgi:hypothetical protein
LDGNYGNQLLLRASNQFSGCIICACHAVHFLDVGGDSHY